MDISSEQDNDLEDLIQDLERATKITAKQRSIKISSTVDKIASQAYENGLETAQLDRLLDTITLPNYLDQASIGALIRNLYPAGKVPDRIIIKVIGSLGHGRSRPSFVAQAALLKWLIMVYDVLENQKVLSQVYSLFFNLLDTIAIRPQLCHVLSLITRRKHVRPFRIQVMMELMRQAGNEPPLVGLMRVYKDYYPEIIVGDVVSGRASVFTHPNPEWRQRLGEIQEKHFQRTQDGLPAEKRAFRISRRTANGTGRTRSSIIPEVRTAYASENSVTLEEIEAVHDFVQKLEKIEPPNQLVAVLGDPLLQKFLQLRSFENYEKRIDNWLRAFFEDHQENMEPSEVKILEMLGAILEYTRYTKKLPAACLHYLNSILPSWNGTTGQDTILQLLTYTPISSFEGLYKQTFQPLEEAILEDPSDSSKLILLTFYNSLLTQWSTTLLSTPTPHPPTSSLTIASLTTHTNNLTLTLLQTTPSIHTLSTILSFYETSTSLLSLPILQSTLRITLPPAELIYTLHFTSSLPILSRLCSILSHYKKAFEIAMAPKPAVPHEQTYPKDYVNSFNGFLMDICNCLWRARAFNTSDPNALGCLLSPEVSSSLSKYVASLDTTLSLPSLFSFSLSPVLGLLAIEYVRELEDGVEDEIQLRHAGPVTQNSLKQLEKDGGLRLGWLDYKAGVLRYLEGRGVGGVGELMYNTMKNLMGPK